MSATLLGKTSGPTINSVEAGIVVSPVILENIVMGVIEDDGKGITQSFSTDTQAAQIKAIRIKPLAAKGRRLGANINGGNFNNDNAEQPQTAVEMINILDTFDPNIDIAHASMSMIDINLLDAQQKNIAQAVAKMLNAITIGAKVKKALNEGVNLVTYQAGTDDLMEKLLALGAKLDDGDEDNGIQYFPKDDRCYVMRSSFKPEAYKKGVLTIGGANLAYEMVAKGAVSPNAQPNANNGYAGEFDGTPIMFASAQVWGGAEDYLGLPAGEIADVYGYVSSGMGTARALAHDNTIKIIDCPNGAGIRLQPVYRMGCECWYAKANAFLVKNTFDNPVTKAKTLYNSYAADVIPPASRMYGEVTWSAKTPTLALETGATAVYRGYKFVVSTTAVPLTIQGYVAATAASGGTGTFTSGSAVTFATSGTYYAYTLVIMTDGTVVVEKSAATITN